MCWWLGQVNWVVSENADFRRSKSSAFSKRAIVSNVMLEQPFNKFETYCCVHPIRRASSACVIDCSSMLRRTCRVICLAYVSQNSLSFRHCAFPLHRDPVPDRCSSRNSVALLIVWFQFFWPKIETIFKLYNIYVYICGNKCIERTSIMKHIWLFSIYSTRWTRLETNLILMIYHSEKTGIRLILIWKSEALSMRATASTSYTITKAKSNQPWKALKMKNSIRL